MTREHVLQKVKEIISDQLFLAAEDIEETTTFEEIDTHYTDMNDIINICEFEFGIEIPDADAANFKTVKNVVDYIFDKM